MKEFKDIQDKVWYSLNSLRGVNDVRPKESVLSDYFVSRQYVNVYSPQFIKFALDDIGEKLITFANLIDSDHPHLSSVLDGFLLIDSGFSEDVLAVLDVYDKFQNQPPRILSTFIDTLCKQFPKQIKFISDPRSYIHLIKDEKGRDGLRQLTPAVDIELKPSLYCKMPSNFQRYTIGQSSPTFWYGFHRMTMTNAAIILAKTSMIRVPKMRAVSYHENLSINPEIKRLIGFVDQFPTCKMKPIFDKFWIVDSGHGTYALLGEHNSKCYFIICWN